MAEAKQLAEKVDRQTKVIEEAVEKRAAFKEELVTVILKIKTAAGYRASAQAFTGYLLGVDQERKATTEVAPRVPAANHTAHQEARSEVVPPVQGTGQRDDHRANSPGRGSPLNAEHGGNLAELMENDVDPSTMPAVRENDDEDVEDVNGDLPSQKPQPGVVLGADAMAVEEARKRIHATLDAAATLWKTTKVGTPGEKIENSTDLTQF
eukprot:2747303-Amphidinium_carterae.1